MEQLPFVTIGCFASKFGNDDLSKRAFEPNPPPVTFVGPFSPVVRFCAASIESTLVFFVELNFLLHKCAVQSITIARDDLYQSQLPSFSKRVCVGLTNVNFDDKLKAVERYRNELRSASRGAASSLTLRIYNGC